MAIDLLIDSNGLHHYKTYFYFFTHSMSWKIDSHSALLFLFYGNKLFIPGISATFFCFTLWVRTTILYHNLICRICNNEFTGMDLHQICGSHNCTWILLWYTFAFWKTIDQVIWNRQVILLSYLFFVVLFLKYQHFLAFRIIFFKS